MGSKYVIATNQSTYSWDYDFFVISAIVSHDNVSGNLFLTFSEYHRKSGLGKGEWETLLHKVRIGTLDSPKLGNVSSLLKRYGFSRERSSSPFNRHWLDRSNNLGSLSVIISNFAKSRGVDMSRESSSRHIVSDKELDRIYGLISVKSVELDNLIRRDRGLDQRMKRNLLSKTGDLFDILDKIGEMIEDYR